MEERKKLDIDLDFLDKKDSSNVATKPATIPPTSVAETKSENKTPQSTIPQVRPWVRYWARYIDISIFSFAFGIFLGIFMPSALSNSSDFVLTLVFLFIWIFVEAILLSSWGTTPGKWLLKVKVGYQTKIDFSTALNRSFNVWLKGLGIGIPIIALFTQIAAYNHLTKEGVTTWDRDGHFTITHEKIGVIRIIVATVILGGFALLLAASQS